MSVVQTLHKMNPGYPRIFNNAEEAQDWLPFGADDETVLAAAKQDPHKYLEWALHYNAWEEKGRDV